MTDNIDQLKIEVDNIKNSLNELKNNVTLSEEERKNKAENIKKQAETTKQKIQAEIDALSNKTDNESKKKKEEAETLLDSFNEIMVLYNSILDNSKAATESTLPATTSTTTTPGVEEKWFFWKIWEWLWNMWSDVTSWDKRKEQPWKNLLYVAWVGLTWYAAHKWVKALWNRAFWDKEDEEWDEGDEESTEKKTKKKKKKSFWKTTTWKVLKRLWIWATAWTLWYWIGKKLHLWWDDEKNPTDSSSDKVKFSAYEEFYKDPNNKEAVENYEQLWENIDVTYESLFSKELQAGYQDELTMKRIAEEQSKNVEHYKWIIPFCLDNKFWSIESILSQNSSMKEAISWWLRSMINYVKSLGNDFMKTLVDSFLSKLPSWTLISNFSWSLSEKIDKWIASNQNAETELKYFFRQSIRVQTYLFEKRDQLEDKIAEDNARKYGFTKEKILKDKELHEKYVEKDERLQKFLMSSISAWMWILKDNAIFDNKVWDEVKESVKNLDKQRNKVLGNTSWWKDILQIIYEKKEKWETITDSEKQLLGKSCDWIIKDIDENIMDAVEESAWNIYWDLFRTDDANLRKYLDNSWLEKVFQEYKIKIAEKKWELLSWRLDAEWIAALAETINNMLALKKEAVLWSQTIEKDYDENGNIIYRVPWFLTDSIGNLVKWAEKLWNWERSWVQYIASAWLGTWIMITLWWTIYWVKTWKRWIAKKWLYIATLPVSWVYSLWKWAVKRTPMWRNLTNKIIYWSPKWVQRITIFKWEQWADNLLEAFRLWKVSLNDAEEIATKKITSYFWTQKTRDKWCKTFDVNEKTVANIRERIFDKYIPDWEEWAKFLRELKSNNELYQKAVKYFDDSTKLQSLIQWRNASMSQIEEEIQKVETAKKINITPDWADNVVKPSQELLDNPHYKKLQSDIDSEISSLEMTKKWETEWSAKFKQIDEQIKKLKEFKKKINKASVQELESLEWMYKAFLKWGKWKVFFENMDTFVVLLRESSSEIGEALEKLDWIALRRAVQKLHVQNKLTNITDDMLRNITTVLEDIKVKNVLKVWDSAVQALEFFLKMAWALT